MLGKHPEMWAQEIQYLIAMAEKDGCTVFVNEDRDGYHLKVYKDKETFEVRL